ncbi:uncharacterized protein [Nicotiana sylvestris]|uniref:uncharacterized protein n=1 Tax=Nicotiana sylvestris TaxID=4096 RepID=UPI00388CB0C8
MRHCPNRGGGGMDQPTGSVSSSTLSVLPPARGFQQSTSHGRGRGAVPNSGDSQNRTYAFVGRHDLESSSDVVIGILFMFCYDVYALIDPGSTLSYVTPFVANKFGVEPELTSKLLAVSTTIGDSMIDRRVYRGCTMIICTHQTSANLFELEMVDFDVIMGMDWLASCYANVDCRMKMVRFQLLGEPVIKWKGNIAMPKGRLISYLKERKMISKGYIYHLIHIRDADAKPHTLQSIPMVNEFPNVFPDELPGLPPEREIEFSIDVLSNTQPISIPPYMIAPTELQELKVQLKDLLDKGFIRSRTSHWGALVLFQELKNRLTSAPVLTLPEGTEGYVVHCDASGIGLGCVLMQRGKTIAYESGQLKKHEKHYPTHDLELAAVIYALKIWQQDLYKYNKSSLVAEVKAQQYEDPTLVRLKENIQQCKITASEIGGDGSLRYQGRLCVPNVAGLQEKIMINIHQSRYSILPVLTKMYHDVKEQYWWDNMKKSILEFVAQCPSCQQVKIEYQKPSGLL